MMNSNRQRMASNYMSSKIKMKAGLAIIRLSMLYLFYFLDHCQMTIFLKNLTSFLLIHEALVISNCILVISFGFYSRFFVNREVLVPSFCTYLDLFNNFLFFTWFVYGNLMILTDRDGVEQSLQGNKMLTYYVTVMILLGFFIYSKLIFYIIFFISFCPCITYVLCVDLHQDYQQTRRTHRIHERLKEEQYDAFVERVGFTLECCIICTNEFSDKDSVIMLPCNLKHTFHSACIRQWIDKKAICPLCRVELRSDEGSSNSQMNQNNNGYSGYYPPSNNSNRRNYNNNNI